MSTLSFPQGLGTRGINQSHGHVTPRQDNLRARCGGPGLCKVCQGEWFTKHGANWPLTEDDPMIDHAKEMKP